MVYTAVARTSRSDETIYNAVIRSRKPVDWVYKAVLCKIVLSKANITWTNRSVLMIYIDGVRRSRPF